MAAVHQATKLNVMQLHLLKMFARPMDEQDLAKIKSLLSNYYAQKSRCRIRKTLG